MIRKKDSKTISSIKTKSDASFLVELKLDKNAAKSINKKTNSSFGN